MMLTRLLYIHTYKLILSFKKHVFVIAILTYMTDLIRQKANKHKLCQKITLLYRRGVVLFLSKPKPLYQLIFFCISVIFQLKIIYNIAV